MPKRDWRFFFSLGYVALFLFLFVLKTAPEQRLRVSTGIEAAAEEVAAVFRNEGPAHVSDNLVALLLTRAERMDVSIKPQGPRSLLTVEMRWRVRGGLLGQTLDNFIGRPAREAALATALRRVKAQSEVARLRQANGAWPAACSLRPMSHKPQAAGF